MGRSVVSQAASSMTGPTTIYAFDSAELLNALGLEGTQSGPASKSFSLGEGAWDPTTGGAIALRTTVTLDAGRPPE